MKSQSQCFCAPYYSEKMETPDTIISISSEVNFAICGWFENDFVSEFTVTKCGQDSILNFYGAVLNYKFHVDGDTLVLTDYRFFIDEKPMFYPWAVEKYFDNKGNIEHKREIVYKLTGEVSKNDFLQSWSKEIRNDYSVNQELVTKTFLLSLTDTMYYNSYFSNYRDTFQIDGVIAEYYNELSEMYKEYNNK